MLTIPFKTINYWRVYGVVQEAQQQAAIMRVSTTLLSALSTSVYQLYMYLCLPAVHVPLCTSYLVSTTLLSALYLPLCTICISVV
mgnify:CR=1 FL=1